jgi:hypothetical protein
MDRPWAMKTPCPECPWRKDAKIGKFPPERYVALEKTCRPGGLLQPFFACHMSQDNKEIACASMLKVVGYDINAVRLAMLRDSTDYCNIDTDLELYSSYDEMAEANGAKL